MSPSRPPSHSSRTRPRRLLAGGLAVLGSLTLAFSSQFTSSPAAAAPGDVTYEQNFDAVADGGLPSGWTPVAGTWKVEDGALVGEPGSQSRITFGPHLDNFRIEATVRFDSVANSSRWIAALVDVAPSGAVPWWQAALRSQSTAGNGIEFANRVGDGWSVPYTAASPYDAGTGRDVPIRIDVQGASARWFFDGQEVLKGTISRTPDGVLGFAADGARVVIDDVVLTEIEPPPPPYTGEPLDGEIAVIAHRGASAYLPEHTFPAYDLAVEMDTDMLECDVMVTKDEQLVCLHDGTVNRTARDPETGQQITGPVDSFTLAELREMDFGLWRGEEHAGATIVPLAEQLMCYRAVNPEMRFHLETKPSSPRGDQLLVDLLDRLGYVPEGEADPQNGKIIIQSFHAASLQRIKELSPSLPTAYLGAYFAPGVQVPDTYDAVAPNYGQILNDPEYVGRMHEQGKPVHTWTVNNPEVMDTLISYGVDGIFSDRPDVLRERVDASGLGIPAEERGNPADFERGCRGIAGTVNSIDDVPITPQAQIGTIRANVQPGSTVPVPFELDLRGGNYDGALNAEVTLPDGTVVPARVVGSLEDGYNVLVRTDRAQRGQYVVEVQDEVGFQIGEASFTTR